MSAKRPVSVLVVIHTTDQQVLLLERTAHPGFWQSVTGSQEGEESLAETALREVGEETGLRPGLDNLLDWRLSNRYEIYPAWRHRYAQGVSHNTEHVFGLRLAEAARITVAPEEHLGYVWLPWREAAGRVFSWSNRDAILMLGH
ncbi:MAG: dihydroneopterin triphosphate diphosphatase [Sulfuritalea sp.]|nr:dihydroneopterin triphosphate diphosphatase [Sulfuritalea sp.]